MTIQEGVTNGDAPTSSTAELPKDGVESLVSELREAVMRFQPERVRRLLEQDNCPIDRTIINDAAVAYFDKAVFEIIASHLYKQRQELVNLARKHLSPEQLWQLGVRPNQRRLNSQAAAVAAALAATEAVDYNTIKLLVPDIIFPGSATSVYFLVGCNKDAAQILYNVGFKNVGERDHLMYTPLTALTLPKRTGYNGQYKVDTAARAFFNYLEMCKWFRDRTAWLYRPLGVSRITALHYVAGKIGKAFASLVEEQLEMNPGEDTESHSHRFVENWTVFFQPSISKSGIIRAIMRATKHRDLFSCPCSAEGSVPLNVLLNEIIINYIPTNKGRTPAVISGLVGAFLLAQKPTGSQDARYTPYLHKRVASVVFRACSFACLGLAHSCRSASINQLTVLSTERRITHNELDDLVSEYEAEFQQSDKSIAMFLIEEWAMGMTRYQLRKQSKDQPSR
ncbi:uncharacterized protein APUU_41298S [Aspergillus puulaauensis]|uniref:Uncharacterized protein n=1 Tax=Aspergillus puulaauensis TaxID=1220207 RepID=A0A7R7XQD9_9EURO|nr:uncharacterized protein APUU_41298S [Aspergillus puulaauensis]BCS24854.1 hypothetical protein APUU_41298S [Aspergillus puulaauensis]